YRSLYIGQAQSFDTLLYARSLWGLAHGDPINPVVGVHALSVHAHFGNLLLIPFARCFPSAAVLIAAQTSCLFAMVFLTARRGGALCSESTLLASSSSSSSTRSRLAFGALGAVVVGLLVTAGSPLVLNPFLFDVRPDFLGLPIAVWAL